jgi:RNase P subunit RPR2
MNAPPHLVCSVCHRPLLESDQYLVRFHSQQGTTVVHRSLCFPPARTGAARKPVERAAA